MALVSVPSIFGEASPFDIPAAGRWRSKAKRGGSFHFAVLAYQSHGDLVDRWRQCIGGRRGKLHGEKEKKKETAILSRKFGPPPICIPVVTSGSLAGARMGAARREYVPPTPLVCPAHSERQKRSSIAGRRAPGRVRAGGKNAHSLFFRGRGGKRTKLGLILGARRGGDGAFSAAAGSPLLMVSLGRGLAVAFAGPENWIPAEKGALAACSSTARSRLRKRRRYGNSAIFPLNSRQSCNAQYRGQILREALRAPGELMHARRLRLSGQGSLCKCERKPTRRTFPCVSGRKFSNRLGSGWIAAVQVHG